MTFRLSHLAALLALAIVVTSAGGIAVAWSVAEDEFRDLMEDELENQAELLAGLLGADGLSLSRTDLVELLDEILETDEEDALWITVYDVGSGAQLSNLEHDLPPSGGDDDTVSLSFGGYDWHGYRARAGDTIVQLMRRNDLYAELQEEFAEDIGMPTLIASCATLLLLAVLMILTLWPVMRLARQIETRGPESLTPLAVRTPAAEIRILRDAVNRLMQDVDDVLRRERRFASDVAHELRTPLSTLTLELADDDPDLAVLRDESRRLSRLVDQLLMLTRLEQRKWEGRLDAVPLPDLCARIAGRLAARFAEAGMTLDTRVPPLTVRGDPTLLEALLQNLLQNVLAHCPAGTHATLRVDEVDGGTRVAVVDDGPGIAAELRTQMNRGFTRLDSKTEGFGLGLAICNRVAAAHDASIRYDTNPDAVSGLLVEVVFPASRAKP